MGFVANDAVIQPALTNFVAPAVRVPAMRVIAAFVVAASVLTGFNAHAITFKIATLSPEGSVWVRELRRGAKEIAAQTDDRVKFKFYTGGVMGDDKAVLRKMRVGQLHGAIVPNGALTQAYPELGLYSLPMVFRDFGEVDHVRASLDEQLIAGLESKGYISFGLSEVGFAYAMSKARATSVADARAQKVWIPDGDPTSEQAIVAFGITPIPLPLADVLSGLQTGLINAVAIPPVGAITLQWHTQVDYVLDLPLLYVLGQLIVSERQFKKLSAADQALVRELMGQTVSVADKKSREDNEKASVVLRQQVEWLTPTEAETDQWRDYADQAIARLVQQGLLRQELYDQMMRLLAEYRSSSST